MMPTMKRIRKIEVYELFKLEYVMTDMLFLNSVSPSIVDNPLD